MIRKMVFFEINAATAVIRTFIRRKMSIQMSGKLLLGAETFATYVAVDGLDFCMRKAVDLEVGGP